MLKINTKLNEGIILIGFLSALPAATGESIEQNNDRTLLLSEPGEYVPEDKELESETRSQLNKYLLALLFHDTPLQMVVVTDKVGEKITPLLRHIHSASFREDLSFMLITGLEPVPTELHPLFNKIIATEGIARGTSEVYVRSNQHTLLHKQINTHTDTLQLSMQVLAKLRAL